jgi:dihydroorotase
LRQAKPPTARQEQRSLLIRGGHLIDPAAKVDSPRDILLREGRVAEVGLPGKIGSDGREVFDARGLLVAPGFIDLHVHLREPGQAYKETIATGTASAARGGFTSVCCMPNTQPVVDSPHWVSWIQAQERGALVHVFPIAAATEGSRGLDLTDFRALHRAGAVAFTDDGKPILEDKVMGEALRAAAKVNAPLIQHAEDTRATAGGAMNQGPTSFRLGLRGMPASAEASIVERDIKLALEVAGARLHVAHLSTEGAIRAVRAAKLQGLRVTCEVTPHHFTLTDAAVADYDTNCKMNPPLRSSSDVAAIWEAIADGTVDAIATDHAPHALEEKMVEFEQAAFGITGLETALGLAITVLYSAHRVPLSRIVELLSAGPARVVDLEGRGTLAEGSRADVTIFDAKKRWIYESAKGSSLSRNTPFDRYRFTGKVISTIVDGKTVYGRGA